MVFTVTGFDFEGGHFEGRGVSPAGQPVPVPLHRHEVSVDFTRIELEYDYTFKRNWDIWLRLPYEIKRRGAGIELVDSASVQEQEAMARNLSLHHDSQTLTGVSDFKFLVAHRKLGLFRDGDAFDIGFGTSLPTGATENDPFKAADAALEHEHIQFGTGTFDPLLELRYTAPLASSVTLGTFLVGRFPFYESSKTYQGPREITAGLGFLYAFKPRWILRSTLTGYYQDFAHWDGVRDINSGLWSLNSSAGATWITQGGLQVSGAIRFPVVQETLADEGDTFEQSASFLLSFSHSFKPKGPPAGPAPPSSSTASTPSGQVQSNQ